VGARAYCEGKDFTEGGLRYWVYKLYGRPRTRRIRIAKVVRATGLRLNEGQGPDPALVLEVGALLRRARQTGSVHQIPSDTAELTGIRDVGSGCGAGNSGREGATQCSGT
jgi:hypothetical protein